VAASKASSNLQAGFTKRRLIFPFPDDLAKVSLIQDECVSWEPLESRVRQRSRKTRHVSLAHFFLGEEADANLG
jgi:hypothetical protein